MPRSNKYPEPEDRPDKRRVIHLWNKRKNHYEQRPKQQKQFKKETREDDEGKKGGETREEKRADQPGNHSSDSELRFPGFFLKE